MSTLRRATMLDLSEVYRHFAECKTWFSHVRRDYIARMIERECVIYHDSVIIVFHRYTRRQRIGESIARKGDVILHQILHARRDDADAPRDAAREVMKRFVDEMNATVWLSVRASNDRARRFYLKCGFEIDSEIEWMGGELPGVVYVKRKRAAS